MLIRPFEMDDTEEVSELWTICGLTRPWNDPKKDILRKMKVQPELFLVIEVEGRIVATAMGGYDGHRGAVYYLAVHPQHQGQGYGGRLMREVERLLTDMGCAKLNVMIRTSNLTATTFYEEIGYEDSAAVVFGKRLIPDVAS